MDAAVNADNKEQLEMEETDDSCITKYVSGDLFGEVREVDSADLKKEHDDVGCIILSYSYIHLSQEKEFLRATAYML